MNPITPYFPLIFDLIPVSIYIKSVEDEFRYVLWNQSCEKTWGLTRESMNGQKSTDLFHEETARILAETDRQAVESQKIVHLPELKIETKAGTSFWINMWKFPVFNEAGKAIFVVGIAQDITQAKLTADESNLRRRQIENISANAPGILYQVRYTPDQVASFTFFSQRVKEILGLEPEEVMGPPKTLYGRIHPEDRPEFFASLEKAFATRQKWQWEGRVQRKDGQYVIILGQSTPYKANDGCIYWDGILQDVTPFRESQRLLQEQTQKFHQAARLISLGEMAAGVAHEINTPLTTIGMLSEMATGEIASTMGETAKPLKHLDQINEMVFKISKIINSMRSYARKGTQDPFEECSFLQIAEEVLSVCGHRLKQAQILVDINSLNPELKVYCQPIQISQVLLNLINNSCDAIRNLDEKWIRIELEKSNEEGIFISVTDSGQGLDPAVSNHIFESFFTTKGPQEGTGLGLSMAKNIMKAHSGDIYLDQQSANTRFVLKFPTLANKNPELKLIGK